LEFDISNTTKFDGAMAAGYALIADQVKLMKQDREKIYDVKEYFRPTRL
jgi:hypothetical protein